MPLNNGGHRALDTRHFAEIGDQAPGMSAVTAFTALSVRAASTTVAPSLANRRAAAVPMPRLPR
ncbi:hypothetical protein A5760_23960 [Mycobacterium colombiense]|uniref:Uncharacterized protein n=1 Tax=Mycobacterium colombiense TaxID=339268 RepID=A0A1A0VZ40_9MYCO|nr:hypothetical protein [Mycobacterium colombiense]OBB88503.1 hypothetical protein A5760_23960 [Mycobacterium colombiense]